MMTIEKPTKMRKVELMPSIAKVQKLMSPSSNDSLNEYWQLTWTQFCHAFFVNMTKYTSLLPENQSIDILIDVSLLTSRKSISKIPLKCSSSILWCVDDRNVTCSFQLSQHHSLLFFYTLDTTSTTSTTSNISFASTSSFTSSTSTTPSTSTTSTAIISTTLLPPRPPLPLLLQYRHYQDYSTTIHSKVGVWSPGKYWGTGRAVKLSMVWRSHCCVCCVVMEIWWRLARAGEPEQPPPSPQQQPTNYNVITSGEDSREEQIHVHILSCLQQKSLC